MKPNSILFAAPSTKLILLDAKTNTNISNKSFNIWDQIGRNTTKRNSLEDGATTFLDGFFGF